MKDLIFNLNQTLKELTLTMLLNKRERGGLLKTWFEPEHFNQKTPQMKARSCWGINKAHYGVKNSWMKWH